MTLCDLFNDYYNVLIVDCFALILVCIYLSYASYLSQLQVFVFYSYSYI